MTIQNSSDATPQPLEEDPPGAPAIVWALAGAIVAGFLWQISRSDQDSLKLLYDYAVIPVRYDPEQGAEFSGPLSFVAPLLGHAFLHGGWIHLILNVVALLALGKALAERTSQIWFLTVFALGAAAGAGLFIALNTGLAQPLVGCSGAVCAVYGAIFANLWRQSRAVEGGLKRLDVLMQAGMFLGLNVFLAMAVRASGVIAIAWEAHLGGFLAGVALGFLRR